MEIVKSFLKLHWRSTFSALFGIGVLLFTEEYLVGLLWLVWADVIKTEEILIGGKSDADV